jgi:hypothetical protein
MSNTDSLAKKIAELLENERPIVDLSSIQTTLDAVRTRLDKLEAATIENPGSPIPILNSSHPSLDKFAIAEAVADQIFASQGAEKACTFEPNGKPCDHCSMCSSRGF